MDRKKHVSDSAYKYLFSSKPVFHQFITRFIDEDFAKKIKLNDIELIDRSFVSDEFLQRESDIIYKVRSEGQDVYFYILIEFQSTVDKTIPVRMLLYITQLYDQLFRSSTKGKLPAIFPVLLYNGKKKWTVPFDIKELIHQNIPSRYIPSFSYYPVIENRLSEEVLVKIKGLVASLMILENQEDAEAMREKIDLILTLLEEEQPEQIHMFANCVNQLFRYALDKSVIDKIYNLTEVKSMLTEIADRVADQGKQEGKLEDAAKMLQKGFSIDDICDITGLTKEQIEALKRN